MSGLRHDFDNFIDGSATARNTEQTQFAFVAWPVHEC
jgi:hypothetical protein